MSASGIPARRSPNASMSPGARDDRDRRIMLDAGSTHRQRRTAGRRADGQHRAVRNDQRRQLLFVGHNTPPGRVRSGYPALDATNWWRIAANVGRSLPPAYTSASGNANMCPGRPWTQPSNLPVAEESGRSFRPVRHSAPRSTMTSAVGSEAHGRSASLILSAVVRPRRPSSRVGTFVVERRAHRAGWRELGGRADSE